MTNSPAQCLSNGPVARLRAELAKDDNIVVGPGVYDGITARIALKSGFDCLYMVKPNVTFFKKKNIANKTRFRPGLAQRCLSSACLI